MDISLLGIIKFNLLTLDYYIGSLVLIVEYAMWIDILYYIL